MYWLIVVLLFVLIIYKICVLPLNYWKKRNVLHAKAYPLVGSHIRTILKKVSFYDSMIEIYNEFPNARFSGLMSLNDPQLLIRDVDLVKDILVKHFDHFVDHRLIGNKDIEPLFSQNLVQLEGQEWKEMRALLSPAFTSSKMKAMFTLMSDCASQLPQHFASQNRNLIEVDLKDLFTRYTNDVIATCAFGIQCNSLKDKENEFLMMGREVTNTTFAKLMRGIFVYLFPTLAGKLKTRLLSQDVSSFFCDLIKSSIDYRLKNNIVRPDMIHLLLEARKGRLDHDTQADLNDKGFAIVEESSIGKVKSNVKEISDLDIAAQGFIFFLAGFETSANLLCFLATELAINVDVQEKLLEEIDNVMGECNQQPTYEAILGMKYLDMILCETLRKWPPAVATDRKCTKEFKIEASSNDEGYTLNVNDLLVIPIIGFHRDEKYFPNPNKFDPERFSDENKSNIKPYSYMPFGIGPRACIGSRFALLEIKIVLVHLLAKFKFVPVEKTTIPLVLSKKTVKIEPENGFWLGIQSRAN